MRWLRHVRAQMRRSTVIGAAGDSVQDSIRTSYGAFLPRRRDAIVVRIEDRLAAWTQLPMTHQEDLQVCVQTCLTFLTPSTTDTVRTHIAPQEENKPAHHLTALDLLTF